MRSARLIAAIATMIVVLVIVLRPVEAELENHVYTSRNDHIRMVVPRGWRESDAPSYPGLLLWMMRPDAKIVLTAEPFTRELYCSWPVTCRTSHDFTSMTARYACALRQRLTAQGMRIGPVQAGPKENEDAGLTSVWFEYDDGKHFMRQAVALGEDRAYSLVLAASTGEARNSNVRAFDQALRTLRPLTSIELGGSNAVGADSNLGSASRGNAPVASSGAAGTDKSGAGGTSNGEPANAGAPNTGAPNTGAPNAGAPNAHAPNAGGSAAAKGGASRPNSGGTAAKGGAKPNSAGTGAKGTGAKGAGAKAGANTPTGAGSGSATPPIEVDAGVPIAPPADAAVVMTPAIAAEMPAPMPKKNPVGSCTQ
jgi:hypothetical protein